MGRVPQVACAERDRGRWRHPEPAPGRHAARVPVRHPHRRGRGQRHLRVGRGAHPAGRGPQPPRRTRRARGGRGLPRHAAHGGCRRRRRRGGGDDHPPRVSGTVRGTAGLRRIPWPPGGVRGRQPRRRGLVEPEDPAAARRGGARRRLRAVVLGQLRVAAHPGRLLRARQPVRPGQRHRRLRQPARHAGRRARGHRDDPAARVRGGRHPRVRPAAGAPRLPGRRPSRPGRMDRRPHLLPVPRPGAPVASGPPGVPGHRLCRLRGAGRRRLGAGQWRVAGAAVRAHRGGVWRGGAGLRPRGRVRHQPPDDHGCDHHPGLEVPLVGARIGAEPGGGGDPPAPGGRPATADGRGHVELGAGGVRVRPHPRPGDVGAGTSRREQDGDRQHRLLAAPAAARVGLARRPARVRAGLCPLPRPRPMDPGWGVGGAVGPPQPAERRLPWIERAAIAGRMPRQPAAAEQRLLARRVAARRPPPGGGNPG
jgi:hypothetical protein